VTEDILMTTFGNREVNSWDILTHNLRQIKIWCHLFEHHMLFAVLRLSDGRFFHCATRHHCLWILNLTGMLRPCCRCLGLAKCSVLGLPRMSSSVVIVLIVGGEQLLWTTRKQSYSAWTNSLPPPATLRGNGFNNSPLNRH
jgi:hypothetical protein